MLTPAPGQLEINSIKKFEKNIDKFIPPCYTIIKVEGNEGKPQSKRVNGE